jgi:hypothetical protein
MDDVGSIAQKMIEQLRICDLPAWIQGDLLAKLGFAKRLINVAVLTLQIERLVFAWICRQKKNADLVVIHGTRGWFGR